MMKTVVNFGKTAARRFNALVDMRIVAVGLGVFAITNCSADQQGNAASPVLGVYVQIDRVARPGVKEIFENYSDRETSNRNSPASDPAMSSAIMNFMSTPSSTPNGRAANSGDAATVQAKFYPDELQADLDADPSTVSYLSIEHTGSGYGGRALTDPAMETDLQAVYGSYFGATAGTACLQTDNLSTTAATVTNTFPYQQ